MAELALVKVDATAPLAGLTSNEAHLAQLYAGSVASFLLLLCARACRAPRNADGEIALIRWCTKLL